MATRSPVTIDKTRKINELNHLAFKILNDNTQETQFIDKVLLSTKKDADKAVKIYNGFFSDGQQHFSAL
jgi:hypothetical protein